MIDTAFSNLQIHASNRLETLAARLAEQMGRHPCPPLAAERVVVPHPALGRWLRLELACALGVAAHIRIELPAQFAWSLMQEALPSLPDGQPFAPGCLRWRIFDALARWSNQDEVSRYLADGDPRKRFELADQLARMYDRCLLYRPGWMRDWAAGKGPHWQARLWRDLIGGGITATHWVDAIDVYRRSIAQGAGAAAKSVRSGQPPLANARAEAKCEAGAHASGVQSRLPHQGSAESAQFAVGRDGSVTDRVSFFGVAFLSPSYLEFLRAASRNTRFHLFLLSPCREFWADTRSLRERRGQAEDDRYYSEGNELLSAWGRPARDMQALLAEELGAGNPNEIYDEPDGATRLGVVQRDILDLCAASQAHKEAPWSPSPVDHSLEVHVCHSATREVEVLQDRLLGLFDAHADIEPADVLVLTPSLDNYGPAIEAVFGATDLIPFNIGHRQRRDSAAVKAFLDLLALPGGRYGFRAVLAPLRAASVQAQFGIEEGELAEIQKWLQQAARVRWGIDGAHRAELGAPSSEGHTWRLGLRRLLLGYALPDEAGLFKGIAPCALTRLGFDAGPADYERLGCFAHYCELAFQLDGASQEQRTASQWTRWLRTELLTPFFSAGHFGAPEIGRETDAVARLINDFASECGGARHAENGEEPRIPFAVLRDVLNQHAIQASAPSARLADGVSVGPLASGQVFPAKVVCVLGMNDPGFPRRPSSASFDLVGADRRRLGDRDVRDEDRFAFLEALLAARRAFLVSYTGRGLRDDGAIPPSVLINELTDYLGRRFPDEDPSRWTTQHPLQPFSRRYFTEPNLYTYSRAMALAAQALDEAADETPARFKGELPADPDLGQAGSKEVNLAELVRFSASPTKYFLRHRLGMRLELDEDEIEEEELFELDNLSAWQLKSDVLQLRSEGATANAATRILEARGVLPPGNLGQLAHRQAGAAIAPLAAALERCAAHLEAPLQEVDLSIGEVRITGEVDHYEPERNELLWWRVGQIRPKDQIEAWLLVLALTCARKRAANARIIGGKGIVETKLMQGPSPEQAAAQLGKWLDAWRAGQCRPLPFFPNASWAFVQKGEREAQSKWEGSRDWGGPPGEGEDGYHQLVFSDSPITEPFKQLACRLLQPLADALR